MRAEGQQEDGRVGDEEALLRSETELVALVDAIRGAEDLANEKLAQLQKRKERLEQQIAAIAQRRSIVTSDTDALHRELSRISHEFARRFGDKGSDGGLKTPQR